MEELNKSCDQCGKKKRKCPGGKPCSRCVHSLERCTFSKRRPRTPSSQVAAQRLRRAAAQSLLEQYAKPTLKRCRWSASPATGLVGLQENDFLCDYFGSAGVMPLASQSGIRETLIKIMLSPHLQQSRAAREDHDVEEEKINARLPGGDDFGRALVGRHLAVDPATCTFWCAIAIGALVKGRPVESVATYVRLAREAIASFSGPANPEMAKAWASLAYVYGFMDEQDKFHGYLALSEGFLRDGGATDALPVGFAELIQTGETIKIFAEDVDPEERESILAQELSRPKLGNLAAEGEICRCVWQSARIFEQAIGAGVFAPRANAIGDEDASDGQLSDTFDEAGRDHVYDKSLGIRVVPFPTRPAEVLRADCMISKKVDVMADLLQFRLLERVAEIPSIRDGIGGLIINDHLLFEKVAKGDAPGALERVGRCIDVFERYPGLCRFKLGTHKAHIMIGILAGMDSTRSRQLYVRLRAAYNLARPAEGLHIPPPEEWRGMSSLCDKMTCRSAEKCGKMAFASSLDCVAVVGQDDDEQGARSNEYRQRLDENATFAQAAAKMPSTVFGAPSGAGRTASVESESVGSGQGTLGGSDVGNNAESEPVSDFVGQGAETCLLLSMGALGDESEKEAVAAEDWLEVTHAMMDWSEADGTFA